MFGEVVGKECAPGSDEPHTNHACGTFGSGSLARRADRGRTRVVDGLGDRRQGRAADPPWSTSPPPPTKTRARRQYRTTSGAGRFARAAAPARSLSARASSISFTRTKPNADSGARRARRGMLHAESRVGPASANVPARSGTRWTADSRHSLPTRSARFRALGEEAGVAALSWSNPTTPTTRVGGPWSWLVTRRVSTT